LYIGYVYIGSTVELAIRLFVGLAIGSIVGVEGVADCAGLLRAVFTVPVVWFKAFLAFSCLACTLIQRRP